MTNKQIIRAAAERLDPATLHQIAAAHHTPEEIAAVAASCKIVDKDGNEKPATAADIEIMFAADELHTFDFWKKEGKSVKKGEKALLECYLWKYTTKPSKEQREKAAAEGKEAAPDPHYYPKASHLFIFRRQRDKRFSHVVDADGHFLYFYFVLDVIVQIEPLKIAFVCAIKIVVDHLFDHGIFADSQQRTHLAAVQREREACRTVDSRCCSNIKVVALDIVKYVAHKLSFHHLCNSRKFHIQTTFLITANGAYSGNCSSADFSAASPAVRSVSASNSRPMMMHGAVTPAPFQPATLM